MHFLSPQACGPQYGYMCGQQQYISGVCANVSSSFEVLNSVAPAVQGRNASEVGLIRSWRPPGISHRNLLIAAAPPPISRRSAPPPLGQEGD